MLGKCRCGKGTWHEIGNTGPQSNGYSFGKGIIGAVVFGPVGAVAGIGGKKTRTVIYQCSNCGATRTVTYDSRGNEVK